MERILKNACATGQGPLKKRDMVMLIPLGRLSWSPCIAVVVGEIWVILSYFLTTEWSRAGERVL